MPLYILMEQHNNESLMRWSRLIVKLKHHFLKILKPQVLVPCLLNIFISNWLLEQKGRANFTCFLGLGSASKKSSCEVDYFYKWNPEILSKQINKQVHYTLYINTPSPPPPQKKKSLKSCNTRYLICILFAMQVKPNSKKDKSGYHMVGVEWYGGGIWHTWFDRDLTIGGRVLVRVGYSCWQI